MVYVEKRHEPKSVYLIKLTFSCEDIMQIIFKMQEFRKCYFKDLS